ncbi:unnamed protein product [Pedinophyceae sp. YPF-701]|nr:unnamed protein product [Pedinophyceae sp. YPF-701]
MADGREDGAAEGGQQEPQAQGSDAEQSKGLQHLTTAGNMKEREINTDNLQEVMIDAMKAQAAMQEKRRARERELAAVKVADADVAVVAREFDLDKKAADRALREHGGNLKEALAGLLSS